ncbi:hypothetical protein PX121_00005, partial [Pseudomonas aeruginosa]
MGQAVFPAQVLADPRPQAPDTHAHAPPTPLKPKPHSPEHPGHAPLELRLAPARGAPASHARPPIHRTPF